MMFGEDSANPQQPNQSQQQQIRIEFSAAETVYANFFLVAGTADEITIYLGANAPLPNVKEQIVKIGHRLMMLPQNAKQLMITLQRAVKAHEDRFGPIEIPAQRRQPDGKNDR